MEVFQKSVGIGSSMIMPVVIIALAEIMENLKRDKRAEKNQEA